MKFTTNISLWVVAVLRLWILLAATSLSPLATFAYDAQRQATIAYDAPRTASFIGCDAACALAQHEGKIGTGGVWGLFGSFAKFLAAETVANPVPSTLARVVDARFVNSPTLGAPGAADVFVTSASL